MSKKLGFLGLLRAYMNRNKLGDILVLRGILTSDDLRKHLKAHKQENLRFGQYLIQQNIISQF